MAPNMIDTSLDCVSPLGEFDAGWSHSEVLKDTLGTHISDAARYIYRRSVITTAIGTDGTVGTTKWGAYPADHDGYPFLLSPSVESDASSLLPDGLKDTLGTHFWEIVGCEYRGCLSKSPDVKEKHRP